MHINIKINRNLNIFYLSNKIELDDKFASPIEVFNLFFPKSLFTLLQFQTNLYFEQYKDIMSQNGNCVKFNWTEMTRNKMWSFIGLTFLIGLVKRKNIHDHWLNNLLLNSVVSNFISHFLWDFCISVITLYYWINQINWLT